MNESNMHEKDSPEPTQAEPESVTADNPTQILQPGPTQPIAVPPAAPVAPSDPTSGQAPPTPPTPTAPAAPPPPPRASASDIVLTSDDLGDSGVEQRVSHLQEAQKVPLVRAVGSQQAYESSGSRSVMAKSLAIMAAAGLVGGILTWAGWQLIPRDENSDAFFSNLMTTAVMVLCIGLCVALVDALRSGSWEKVGKAAVIAIPTAIGTALVFGLIAHFFYTKSIESLVSSAERTVEAGGSKVEALNNLKTWLHPVRGIAWAIIGAGAGLVVGVTSKSVKRSVITTIGGFVGGFLGGFLFDFIATDDASEDLAQVVGTGLTGLLVGLSIGILEEARKSSWIEIVAGGMAGKQFILYQDVVTLGSSPNCNITVIKDPGVEPEAAVITIKGSSASIQATGSGVVNVDGAMHQQTPIADGATITLGSTVLRFRERSKKSAEVGSIRS